MENMGLSVGYGNNPLNGVGAVYFKWANLPQYKENDAATR